MTLHEAVDAALSLESESVGQRVLSGVLGRALVAHCQDHPHGSGAVDRLIGSRDASRLRSIANGGDRAGLLCTAHHFAASRASEVSTQPASIGQGISGSSIDANSMVTTARTRSFGVGYFDELPAMLDPLAWRTNPFWTVAERQIPVKGGWAPDPSPHTLGEPWAGWFYEFVEWNWNLECLSGFQAHLTIDFKTPAPGSDPLTGGPIVAKFDLFSAQGFMFLGHIAPGGVDCDAGYSAARALPPPPGVNVPPGMSYVCIEGIKAVRFADLVSRRTMMQGAAGSGQYPNFMGPASVGLFIEEAVVSTVSEWERRSMLRASSASR